jgi:hypothetical protein
MIRTMFTGVTDCFGLEHLIGGLLTPFNLL